MIRTLADENIHHIRIATSIRTDIKKRCVARVAAFGKDAEIILSRSLALHPKTNAEIGVLIDGQCLVRYVSAGEECFACIAELDGIAPATRNEVACR